MLEPIVVDAVSGAARDDAPTAWREFLHSLVRIHRRARRMIAVGNAVPVTERTLVRDS